MPAARHQRGYVLQLEGQVRWLSCQRGSEAKATGRGERKAEAGGSRFNAGQRGVERLALKKLLKPASKRAAANDAIQQHRISERRACRLTRLARSTKRRVLKGREDLPLSSRLGELARQRQRFGYRRLTALLQREGWAVNHKRIYRLYREQGLALRRKKRGHRMRQLNAAAKNNMLTRPNQRWAMDFVSDTLASGRPFRSLTIVDEYSRECPAIEVDTSLPSLRVLRVLQRMADTCGLPGEIRVVIAQT
jgi:putative transposase